MIGFLKTQKRVGLGTNRVRKTRSPSWPSPLEWSERLKAVKKKKGVTSPVCSALTKTTSLSFHFGGTLSFNPSLPTTTPPRERKVREKRKNNGRWARGANIAGRFEGQKLDAAEETQHSPLPCPLQRQVLRRCPPLRWLHQARSVPFIFFHCLISLSFMGFASSYSYLWWVFVILVY